MDKLKATNKLKVIFLFPSLCCFGSPKLRKQKLKNLIMYRDAIGKWVLLNTYLIGLNV